MHRIETEKQGEDSWRRGAQATNGVVKEEVRDFG